MKYLIFFLSLISYNTFAQEDCTFDQSTQTDEFIRNIPEFSNYIWNDNKKEATILLENGDTLIAHRGGCVHFGISGDLFVSLDNNENYDLEDWLDKCKWMAKRLFSEYDFEVLVSSLKNKTYTKFSENNMIYMVIPHNSYIEYYIAIPTDGKSKKVSIGYYF